ncbi:putative endonuclease V [Tieghemostelium lacteum]|uniref:Putative endonuclease V n=1 Tax=Tieghemostelium lacteum TaxID=361077 RepID=A0A151Z303_TIELA|nr:putative endonuclease V [Tieghemostelium lacteum]|eukprot:KYQ88340.1 putative endonuclease V [Tieghemostelium lacteum]
MNSEIKEQIEKIKELFSNGWITEYEKDKRIKELDPNYKPTTNNSNSSQSTNNSDYYTTPNTTSYNDYSSNTYQNNDNSNYNNNNSDYYTTPTTTSYNNNSNNEIVFKSYDDVPVLNNDFSNLSLDNTKSKSTYNNNNNNNNYNQMLLEERQKQLKQRQLEEAMARKKFEEEQKTPHPLGSFASIFGPKPAATLSVTKQELNNDPNVTIVGWDHGVKFNLGLLNGKTYVDLRDWLKESTSGREPDSPTQAKSDQWKQEQYDLAKRVDKKNYITDISKIKYIGGVDISFAKNSKIDACASLVVLDYKTQKIVYQSFKMVKLTEPYIAGYLAFREAPHLMPLWKDLVTLYPQYKPDVLIVDGNGINHMRACGAACHLGVLMDIPTLGVAKTLLYANGITEEYINNGFKKGNTVEMIHQNEKTSLGYAIYNTHNEIIYISPGHKIDAKTSLQIVQATLKSRPIPEPTFQADRVSRDFLYQYYYKLKSSK